MTATKRTCEYRPEWAMHCTTRAAFNVSRGRKHDAQDSCRRHLAATVDAVMQADSVEVTITRITGGAA